MRVQVVDPPAYTPPYDRSLCAALARAGLDVELLTSHFVHGPVPAADGYRVDERFLRRSGERAGDSVARRAFKLVEHIGDMTRYRREASADVVHYQWLPVPGLDARLLPPARPRVFTAHDIVREQARAEPPSAGMRRLLGRMDAVVTLTEYGARRLREDAGVPADRVHVIPHGAFEYLTRLPEEDELPPDLAAAEGPVVLCFGLIRPYKGVDVLLEAFRSVEGAELWIAGRPLGVSMDALYGLAERTRATVRFVPRFIPDREIPAIFRRADVVVLPHRDAEQSGVLNVALAFGKPIVVTAVGGLREIAEEHGAALAVPPEDPAALASAISNLLSDEAARERLSTAAREAASGPLSWDRVAEQTAALYSELLEKTP